MADFSVPLTVPDAKVAELLDAINWSVNRLDENGNPDPMSGPEARAWLKASVQQSLRDIFRRHKEHLRAQKAIDDAIDIA